MAVREKELEAEEERRVKVEAERAREEAERAREEAGRQHQVAKSKSSFQYHLIVKRSD